MSNNKPAFNYNWKVLTNQEITDHILSIIRNNKEE